MLRTDIEFGFDRYSWGLIFYPRSMKWSGLLCFVHRKYRDGFKPCLFSLKTSYSTNVLDVIHQAELYFGSLPAVLHVENTQMFLWMVSKGQLRSFIRRKFSIRNQIIKKWTKIRNFNHMWNRCKNYDNFTFIFHKIEWKSYFMLFYNIYFTGNWNYIVGFFIIQSLNFIYVGI